jgi:hypothetical protein
MRHRIIFKGLLKRILNDARERRLRRRPRHIAVMALVHPTSVRYVYTDDIHEVERAAVLRAPRHPEEFAREATVAEAFAWVRSEYHDVVRRDGTRLLPCPIWIEDVRQPARFR